MPGGADMWSGSTPGTSGSPGPRRTGVYWRPGCGTCSRLRQNQNLDVLVGIAQRTECLGDSVQPDPTGDQCVSVDLTVGEPPQRPVIGFVVRAVPEVDRDLAELCHHRNDRLFTER